MDKFDVHKWNLKNILKEQGFDDRLKAAGGFSDEEMVKYFLDNSVAAQAAAKIWFGKKGL